MQTVSRPIRDEPIDFTNFALPDSPNAYLVRSDEAPKYEMTIDHLRVAWLRLMSHEPNVVLVKEYSENQITFVQYTRFFRFPDEITVEFVPVDSSHSTINVFSRSLVGEYDFGVNKKRIQRWLSRLPFHRGTSGNRSYPNIPNL